jgi:hypothetical protein
MENPCSEKRRLPILRRNRAFEALKATMSDSSRFGASPVERHNKLAIVAEK